MKGYIHFLGRSRFLKDNYKYERIVNIANNHNESINNYYNDLSDDLLNVISDEGLTLIYYRHLEGDVISKNTKFVLNKADDAFYAKFLAEYLSLNEKEDVTLLFVIRNQSDAIYSLIVQLYDRMLKYPRFRGQLYDESNMLNLNSFSIYKYQDTIDTYKKIISNAKIKILLFEDFLNDREYFVNEISKLFNLENEYASKMLARMHEKRRDKTSEGYYTDSISSSRTLNILHSTLSSNIRHKIFQLTQKNEALKFIDKIYRKKLQDSKLMVPKFSKKQIDSIREYFQANNSELQNTYNIGVNKLIKYKYLL